MSKAVDDRVGFSVTDRFKSIKCALHGIGIMLKYEHNAWVHALATLLVTATGLAFGLNRYEWCLIVIAILLVWAAEALNTAFEFLADVAVPDFHPMVEKGKDVAAGAVLIASVGAVVIGMFILGPRCIELLSALLP